MKKLYSVASFALFFATTIFSGHTEYILPLKPLVKHANQAINLYALQALVNGNLDSVIDLLETSNRLAGAENLGDLHLKLYRSDEKNSISCTIPASFLSVLFNKQDPKLQDLTLKIKSKNINEAEAFLKFSIENGYTILTPDINTAIVRAEDSIKTLLHEIEVAQEKKDNFIAEQTAKETTAIDKAIESIN